MGWRLALILALLIAAASALTDEKAIDAVLQSTENLVQSLGWSKEEVKISRIDTRDAQVGDALIYEFDLEVDGNTIPVKFAEDITSWRYIHPLTSSAAENAAQFPPANVGDFPGQSSVLQPFQLAGPVELWIQDAKDVRLALPHDVDAGALNRVMLADGATVTVTGARELSLARPFKVPLPLTGSDSDEEADGILNLSEQIRDAARTYEKPLVSLRVVGPTSLVASSPSKQPKRPLKVKRLSPGAVEIVKRLTGDEPVESASSSRLPWLWPLPSVNSSDTKLVNVERALRLLLGPKADMVGSFNVLRAKASAVRFYKVEFEVEKKVDVNSTRLLPDWATKPSVQRQGFELVVRVDGDKVVPLTVRPLESFGQSFTTSAFSWEDLSANVSSSVGRESSFHPPVSPLTLDVDWD